MLYNETNVISEMNYPGLNIHLSSHKFTKADHSSSPFKSSHFSFNCVCMPYHYRAKQHIG